MAIPVVQLKGIPTNLELCSAIASSEKFAAGDTTTAFLLDFPFAPHAVEVIVPGMNTTVQVIILYILDPITCRYLRPFMNSWADKIDKTDSHTLATTALNCSVIVCII